MDLLKRGEKILSLAERNVILDSIEDGFRIDGRRIYDFRSIAIEFGDTPGTVSVVLGETRILVKTIAEVITPVEQRPSEGKIFTKLHLSEMASPGFMKFYNLEEYAIEVERIIDEAIRNSHALDLESLCISVGEKVWKINTDIYLLDYGGNIMDISLMGTILSLSHFQRNDISVRPFHNEVTGEIEDRIIVHSFAEKNPLDLNFHHLPFAVTFSFFTPQLYAIDASLDEELVDQGRVTVVMNTDEEICHVSKPGGVRISKDVLLKILKLASVKVREIEKIVKSSLEEERASRKSRMIEKLNLKTLSGNPKSKGKSGSVQVEAKTGRRMEMVDEDEDEEEETVSVSEEEDEVLAKEENVRTQALLKQRVELHRFKSIHQLTNQIKVCQ